MRERREEKRHVVPELYRKYITLKVREDTGDYVPVKLLDFSPRGIRMKSPYEIPVDSAIECLISAPKSITKEVPFIGEIKYCILDEFDGDYLIGAEIIETAIDWALRSFRRSTIYKRKNGSDVLTGSPPQNLPILTLKLSTNIRAMIILQH
jgi:hypothetical protein